MSLERNLAHVPGRLSPSLAGLALGLGLACGISVEQLGAPGWGHVVDGAVFVLAVVLGERWHERKRA